MIFETTVEKILNALENANRITNKNSSLPILGNILFLVSKNILKIRATNLSIGVEFEVGVKGEADGVLAIDGKTISTFLNTIKKTEKIKFSQQNTNLQITTQNNKTTLKTFPYEDFPTLPIITGPEFKIPKKSFIQGVHSTIFASAVSDIKPEIASVCLISEGNTINFVATDSFRLAEKKENLQKNINFPTVVIPNKNILEIAKIIEGYEDDIKVIVNDNQITFNIPGVYITSRIISGAFPDYKQILPKEFTTEVIVLKQDLLNSLKSANIFSDKFNQITISISKNKKKFECISKNNDVGEFNGEIDSTIKGEDVSVSLNHKYLLDSLQVIPQDSIFIGLNGPTKAIVIKGISDNSFLYLLQPMNR
ncbi:MAG: DNA polymerase III subunit beta [Candidatus Pacebacteria bacterium]|nr:DNA polymerase III subunit beta [Candidatus Paceibacterota bacterium]